MFLFNTVLGEELLFRGFLLPRMNGAFGRGDWLANGVLFAAYHLHVPWAMPSDTARHVHLRLPDQALPKRLDRNRRPQRLERVPRNRDPHACRLTSGHQEMRSGRAQTRPDRCVSEVIADALNGSSPFVGTVRIGSGSVCARR